MRKTILIIAGFAAALIAGPLSADAAVKSYWDQAAGRWVKFDTATKRIIPMAPTGNGAGMTADASYGSSPIRRKTVDYDGPFGPNTIVIDTAERRLYYIFAPGKAVKYGVGVGREGFQWSGVNTITRKAEWPGWTPPPEMVAREKLKGRILPAHMDGGPNNPLGARALYIGGTQYRIHGSNEPWTIGHAVSSGCIRLTNEDVTNLYDRVKIGTRVVVLRGDESATQLAALAHPPPEKKEPITAEARLKDDGLISIGVVVPGVVPTDDADTTPTASVAPTEPATAVAALPEARTKDDAVTAALPAVVATEPAIVPSQEALAKDDAVTVALPAVVPEEPASAPPQAAEAGDGAVTAALPVVVPEEQDSAPPQEAQASDDAVTTALPVVVPEDSAIIPPQEARAKDDDVLTTPPPAVDDSAAANSAAMPGQTVPN